MFANCWIFLPVFFSLLRKSDSVSVPPDLTFISTTISRNNSNQEEYICIADGNVLHSAIGWVYPLVDSKEKLPEIVSTYVPELKNDYDCNFSKSKFYCNNQWQQMDDWQHSKFDSYNFKPTLDTRWEKFLTLVTSNNTKEYLNRIEIPHVFQLGFSVRASRNAEIFLCEGWDPENYPCYYINIGDTDNRQTFLRKIKSAKISSKDETKLAKYKSDIGILSENEWKNFALTLDRNGTISLSDMYKNTLLLNYTDTNPLLPIYLFVRSRYQTAFWKIHNNQYIFTNKTKITQMGPTFSIPGKDLCVSLYVSMCKHCKISFYILDNGERQIIKTVFNEHERDDVVWKEVKLLQHDILEDKLKLYVETKYVNNTVSRDGFWAIDDVRVCTEDEIKISRLRPKLTIESESQISCQVLGLPTWRPNQHKFLGVSNEIGNVSSTSNAIKLAWKPFMDNEHDLQHYYVVQYEGKDLCKQGGDGALENRERVKSRGYVVGRTNEITINDLVPYTYYNISYWNLIEGKKRLYAVTTLPLDVPTKEELPRNLTMKITDATNEIRWDSPRCNEIYGPLIYELTLKNTNNKAAKVITDIKKRYTFENLLPFTNYTLEIVIARKLEDINNTQFSLKLRYNFTTSPGVPSTIENLQLYSIDRRRAQLRFNLPKDLHGNPESIQVRWCHPLLIAACKTEIRDLTECKLWKDKYCTDVEKLMVAYDYRFMISLKNKKTHTFGGEASVIGTALNKVPGKPLNLTYEMINCDKTLDYCHLKISWMHPYYQNGTITMFDVILNETSYSATTDTLKSIHEILRIKDYAYRSVYSYIVKYIPYSTPYKIAVRAVNDEFKGQFAVIHIETDNINDYIDQTPELIESTNQTAVFKLPQMDWRLNASTLIIIVQDYNQKKKQIDKDIAKLEIFENENQLCNQYGETWVAKSVELSNLTSSAIVIGDGTKSYSSHLSKTVINKPLQPDTEYCFTFTLLNVYRNSVNVVIYHEKHLFTEPNYSAHPQKKEDVVRDTNVAAYVVPIMFLLLLVVCSAWLGYRYFKRRNMGTDNGEHIYESMPFDDYMVDAVSNETYDKLIHS